MTTSTLGGGKREKEFNPTMTSVKMVKEWSAEQFEQMKKAIGNHFKGKRVICEDGGGRRTEFMPKGYRGAFMVVDSIFGLAYTSSGMYACYGVCNCRPLFDEDGIYSYSYFAISNGGKCCAILQDNEENELCIIL